VNLSELQSSVLQISDIYAREHGIDRDKAASGDWALLKVQEEDVLGMLLIYCRAADIDIEQAMQRKWLHWLEPR
jgi:NTP pyrophosphatase (non-canonical NTP hydrolase)